MESNSFFSRLGHVNPEYSRVSPIPMPDPSAHLFTGQGFCENAPWRAYPVLPTAAYMTNVNLRSANPPPQALFQMHLGLRPGNNTDTKMPGVVEFKGDENFGPFNFMCMPCVKSAGCGCVANCPCKDVCGQTVQPNCPCKKFGQPYRYIDIQ